MSIQKYHLLFPFALLLLFSCSKFTTKTSKSEKAAHPGYQEQLLYIKTNGTNVMPDLTHYNWMPQSIKRATSDALLNLAEVGPNNIAGRTRGMITDLSNPNHIIASGVSGGIFISDNKGISWRVINDQQISPSVTGMDQNPFQHNIIYYCTGEGSGNSADIIGAGVFKSIDGGNTFSQLSATNNANFNVCWSIKCSPKDTNVLYVSTGSAGLWRSKDAGITFSKVYATTTEINDLEVLPNGNVLFAVKGLGVYRSANGNLGTFAKISSINSSSTARGELAYCKEFPNVVYAAISGVDNGYSGVLNGFYKSSDTGKTFTLKSNPNGIVKFSFTWYCLTMSVKSNDSNSIYIASLDAGYSNNGGNSWDKANDMHADHHVAQNMNDSELLVGCDGGICIYKWNNFSQFKSLNNGFNVTQFYSGAVSPHSNNFMGGCQDNGTNESISGATDFNRIFGGDGAYVFYHNALEDTRYLSYQNGVVVRREGLVDNNISKNLPSGSAGIWFIQPYDVSEYNSDWVIYPAGLNLLISKNSGNNFTKLGSITNGKLFASNSSYDANPAVYAGGSNCLMGFDSMLNAKPKLINFYAKLPNAIKSSFCNSIKVIPGYRDRVYLAYSSINDSGRLYKGINMLSGTPKFKNISGNLPKGLPVNWVECDPINPEKVIFAGTDFGLYVTEDSGTTWIKDPRVPNVVVSSIKVSVNKKDIYFFTHGRGVFKATIKNNYNVGLKNSLKTNSLFQIFPVPATNLLNIELNTPYNVANYSIYNMLGELIQSGKLIAGINSFAIETLQSGNYIINIETEGKTESTVFNVNK
jgi:hypothetical protein